MTARERRAVAALVDAVVAPEPPLPPVAETDAVRAFGELLAASPPLNRLALRALVRAFPARGDRRQRLAGLRRPERLPGGRAVADGLRSAAALSYYGDAGVMRLLGYDPAARP